MPDRFVKELLSVPTISIRKWLFRAVPFFQLVPESRQPPLLAPPDWLFTSGRRNRFNTRDLHCLYLSEEETTALSEQRRPLVGQDDPTEHPVIFRVEVNLHRVLDLTETIVCMALGLDLGDLEAPWVKARTPTATQILGQVVAMRSDISAIRFPSVAAKESGTVGVNVVIYREQVASPDKVTIYGRDGKPAQSWPAQPRKGRK